MSETTGQELRDLIKRIDWLDEERRKSNRKLAELEQKLELQARELGVRDNRIQSLQQELTATKSKIITYDQIDPKIVQLRKEMLQLFDKVDERRISTERELERVRRVEQQQVTRELAEIRKELPSMPRIQNELDQRKAEDTRLVAMISEVTNRLPLFDNRMDAIVSSVTYVDESAKQSVRMLNDLQGKVLELQKKTESAESRIDPLFLTQTRQEAAITEVVRSNSDVEKQMKHWFEQVRLAEYDRTQRVDAWQQAFDTYKTDIAKLHQEWVRVADQHKEVKMMIAPIPDWRKQVELQQRELSEMVRLEQQRLQAKLQEQVHENEKFWKNVEIEAGQRNVAMDRRMKLFDDQLAQLQEQITELRRQKEFLQRILNAQSDAVKLFPRVWLEEVEKASANDPNRRRSAALTPVPEE